VQGAYDTYGSAMRADDADYNDIMSKYRSVYDQAGGAGGRTQDFNFNITAPTYQSTPEYQNAIKNMRGLSESGGFSPEDISNIRERAISPIRSVYANANRNIDRQRRLQGGYSPNAAAATAKMARSMSSQISDAVTGVNADIAQKVASNKMGIAGQYAGVTAGEQSNRNDFAMRSADFMRQLEEMKLNNQERMFEFPIKFKLDTLSGMRDTYGTTPARSAMTGNFATNQAELQRGINNDMFGRNIATMNMYR
jgi:hypothetical protein